MQVLTASRLADGDVVYWSNAGWTHDLQQARVIESKFVSRELEQIAAAEVAASRVVDPYFFKVEWDGGRLKPSHYREQIRQSGPTIPYGSETQPVRA